MQQRALATPRGTRNRHQVSRVQEEFPSLRHNDAFARELLLEANRSTGRLHTQRIMHIQACGNVALFSTDIDWRGDDRGGVNTHGSAAKQHQMNSPEVQGERDCSSGFQHREFCRAADVDFTAYAERQARLAIMHGDAVAIENISSWRRDLRCSAFYGNVSALNASDRSRWRFLGTHLRAIQQRNQRQREHR